MAGNRKAFEAVILKWIEELMPGSGNADVYRQLFAEMSDAQMATYVADLKDGKSRLSIIAENMGGVKLETKRNLAIAKKLGHNFFQKLLIDNGVDAPYWTNHEYLIVSFVLRRQAQLQTKKMSVPENNKSIDDLTGQPTGKSRGSKISFPELNVLASHQMTRTLNELVKYRGGDVDGYNAMVASISRNGSVRQETLDALNTKVKSTETLSAYLTGMHLSNTLMS